MPAALFAAPRADARLARAADWLAAGARDRETLVVGETTLAAQALVRRVTAAHGASFGWRPVKLGRLALSLAMPGLVEAGLVAASGSIVEGLSVRVLHQLAEAGGLGRLGPLADRPGLARAVARTLAEVRMAGLGAPALAAHAPDLARLLQELEAHLAAERLADRATVFRYAIDGAARAGGPALLLLDVPVWTALEGRLVARLAAAAPDLLATVPAGDRRTLDRLRAAMPAAGLVERGEPPPGALGRLQVSLFSPGGAPAERGDDVVFLSAPGESRECVEIARRIHREAERGLPFDRIAVLLRSPAQYRAHLQEALRRARIPVHFASGAVLPDPAGRAFLALLACAGEKLSARRFAEYLSLGETPDATPSHEPPPAVPATDRFVPPDDELSPASLTRGDGEEPAEPPVDSPVTLGGPVVAGTLRAPRRWEQILVDSAVIGTRERWERRLAGWREKLTGDLTALTLEPHQREAIERDLAQLEALRVFALPILDDLQAFPVKARWGEWLDRLSALATRTLRRPDRVLQVLAELAPMSPVGPVGLPEVRLVLSRRLAALVLAPGSRSDGKVFVGPIDSARGLAFDLVFVPGLAERMFPQRVTEDPLLRDEARLALGDDLATAVDRIEGERLALRLAVGAARQRVVLSYSRIDAEQARPRVPSFYGLEVLRAVEGRLPSFEALARGAERGAATRRGWPAPADPADAIDEAEHDLAVLDGLVRPGAGATTTGAAHYLIASNPNLARALRHRARRFNPRRWSYADGLVEPDEAARAVLAKHALDARSYSPTALQNFAACPYRFVLQALHKLAPREEPVAIEKIDPLDKGSLVHETLQQLYAELGPRGLLPLEPRTFPEVREALERTLAAVAARFRDRLAPAIDKVWEDGVASIRADLLESLRRESERGPWRPLHLELAFGLPDLRERDPASRTEPLPLDCGITLRGSIDVVEQGPDGALWATDYKTGKSRQKAGSVVGGGESLQPVFYALVLEKLFPGRTVGGGRLSYCTSAGEFKEVRVFLNRGARDAADRVATAVGQALAKGFLPAAPKKDACRWCDYRPVCGPYEEERAAKKRDQGELDALKALRKLP